MLYNVNDDSLQELPYFIFMLFSPFSLQKFNKTRKQSSGMRTTRLSAICPLVTTRCQYELGVDPQVNKFAQVSSDGHQMSLAGGQGPEAQCLIPGGTGQSFFGQFTSLLWTSNSLVFFAFS